MLAKVYRLVGNKSIEKVKKEGKLMQFSSFALVFLNRKDNKKPKFAFITSKKISKNAYMRNKINRALREAVRHHLAFIKPGYSVVILTKPVVVKKYTEEIMNEVKIALDKAKISK
jgi:ribonuclease P protein component